MTLDRDIKAIGIDMIDAGLPSAFVLRILELAAQSEGVEDLVHLWAAAPDAGERNEVEADLHGMIEDREAAGPVTQVTSVDEGDRVLHQRRRLKEHLRWLVAEHGGVTEVARRADMPQPSLSRLLGSMSEPRPATMKRLAAAMGLRIAALSPGDANEGLPVNAVYLFPDAPREGRFPARARARMRRFTHHLGRISDGLEVF